MQQSLQHITMPEEARVSCFWLSRQHLSASLRAGLLQQLGGVGANCARIRETLRHDNDLAALDAVLLNGEAEAEADVQWLLDVFAARKRAATWQSKA